MLKHEALESVGKIVEAFSEINGNYIGEMVKVNSGMCNIAEVRILACTMYPSQRTIMYKFNNYERWPYTLKSTKAFPVEFLRLYCNGIIPEYYELMPRVLEETFLIENEADQEIYERHKKYWEGKRGTYGKTVQGIT